MHRPFVLLLAALTVAAAAGCERPGRIIGPDGRVTGVSAVHVSGPATEVVAGEQLALRAHAVNSAGDTLSGQRFTWAADPESVAEVSATGVVTARAPGQVRVTATAGGRTGDVQLQVLPVPVAAVRLDADRLALRPGQAAGLSAALLDARGDTLHGREVTWTSSAPGVAAVSSAGVVTGMAEGDAQVVARSGAAADTAMVTVADAVARVELAPDTATLRIGQSVQMRLTAYAAGGAVLGGRPGTLAASPAGIVTVDASGVATAVGAGTVRIVGTSEGRADTSTIVVLAPVARVVLTPDTATLLVGDTLRLRLAAYDAAGAALGGRAGTLSASPAGIVTLDGSGLATAVGAGTVRVVGTVEGRADTATLVVRARVARVVLTPDTATVFVGDSVRMRMLAYDASGAVLGGRAGTLGASPAGVLTLDAQGMATGVAPGTARVVGTVEGRADTSTLVVKARPAAVAEVQILTPASTTLRTGDTVQLEVWVMDRDRRLLGGRSVTWTSSAPGIASVGASTGLVTALDSGSVQITATSEGVTSRSLALSIVPNRAGRYRLVEVGRLINTVYAVGAPSRGTGINALGVAVGITTAPTGETRGFRWTDGTDLDLGPAGWRSHANGINRAGTVAGTLDSLTASNTFVRSYAAVWRNGAWERLPDLGGTSNAAHHVSDAGVVVGRVTTPDNGSRGARWVNGVLTEIPALSGAVVVNESGVVGGVSAATAGPALWENGVLRELGTLGGSAGWLYGLNDAGAAVGSAHDGQSQRAYLWQNGAMRDITTLCGQGSASVAFDVNNRLQVVGEYARDCRVGGSARRGFLWENGAMRDLNELLVPAPEWTVTRATEINDDGWIVGTAIFFDGRYAEERAVVLIPTR